MGTVIAKVLVKRFDELVKITLKVLPVLVYGTSGHSERVARIRSQMNLPEIHVYLCTNDPEITSLHSPPVFNIDECPIKTLDL